MHRPTEHIQPRLNAQTRTSGHTRLRKREAFYGELELQVSLGFSDHYKSEDIYWFGMFPVKKTAEEMFQRMVCSVCGFMAVPNILQASHSATDLCCLNAAAPAQLSAPDRRWTGGPLVCVCVSLSCVVSCLGVEHFHF